MNKNNQEKKVLVEKIEHLERLRKSKKEKSPTVIIDFSWKLVLFILGILGVLFWSKPIFTLIIFLFISAVVMSSVIPIVNWLVDRKVPKGWAIFITYFLFIVLFLSVVSVIIVPFISQIDNLIESVPFWVNNFLTNIDGFGIWEYKLDSGVINRFIFDWFEQLTRVDSFQKIVSTVGGVFTWTSIIFASMIFSVYLVIEHNNILDFVLIKIISDEKKDRVKKLVLDVESKLGRWLIGQAVVSAFAATYSWIILSILGVPFALPLAIFTGLMGVIPNLGSIIAGIVMAFVALVTVGPLGSFILLLAFVLFQPIENSFLTPKVMGNAVGLRPIIVMLGVFISIIFFGIMGGFLAVPLMVIIKIIYEFYIDLQKIQAKGSIN